MPFAVSKWPYSSDPRGPEFGGHGWAWGAVAPYAWILSTTNASGPWTFLNDGIILKSSYDDLNTTLWDAVDLTPGEEVRLSKFGAEPPSFPPNSIVLTVQFRTGFPIKLSEDFQFYEYPDAVQVFDGFVVTEVGTGDPDPFIPDPVKVTPAKWNI